MQKQNITYPVELTLALLSDKWKILILCKLQKGTKRFGEINRSINNINQKMLAQQLRSLERDGFITRKVYAEVPPKVEYSLTPLGQSLEPVIKTMFDWSMEHKDFFKSRYNINIDPSIKLHKYGKWTFL
ncbi:winged helix-turn-helix transcriptional regulator [Anaeromicrobium sediminis]|uniref:MarR family transcriptional regulator n=1 Tax=Anaeromicrobium sediminis TaxID=1478221 RepID=A0A267MLD7_9FIRM|nr:helix-turn-helix domain-containing protein [Anaeromicrobium sediminis]PAB60399.1 MarR family transcriptional regulator [Anaeromicrobium sediminis]